MAGKWVLALVMATATLIVLAACQADRGTKVGKPVVLTTFTVLADIASEVAGNHLKVESLTKPGAEIHHYEPTPGDLRRAKDAALILDNGLNLEAWLEKFIGQVKAPRVTVSAGVTPTSIASDSYKGLPNPHAWMSPSNVKVYVDNMAKAFAGLVPDRADAFWANAEAYKKKLDEIRRELVTVIAAVPEAKRALVTCEGAFSYLAHDVGLAERYIWPVNAEQQATPKQIAAVIDFVKASGVPAVFCESTVSDAPMQQVVAATGARFGGILYVDSLSAAGGPVPTYLALLRHDAETIAKGLEA